MTLTGLNACQPEGTDLPFETIDQRDASGTGMLYDAKQPAIVVVAKPEEIASLKGTITSETQTRLHDLDYNAYFAMVVFQGWKSSGGYGVRTLRLTRQGDRVAVHVRFLEPKPNTAVTGEVTSPYHLVRIPKTGTWGRQITFELVANEIMVASLSHYIP